MRNLILSFALIGTTAVGYAQDSIADSRKEARKLTANFNIQTDMHHSLINDASRNSANTYITGVVHNKFVEVGMRYEHLTYPLPGHEVEQGHGIANVYGKLRFAKVAELTLGDFYDQFGSGVILRSYEDRDLGIDNSIRGGRVLLTPFDGLQLKALAGQQRNHFDKTNKIFNSDRGYLVGADAEFRLPNFYDDGWNNFLSEHFNLGVSYVMNYDKPNRVMKNVGTKFYELMQPKYVNMYSGQITYTDDNLTVFYEQAYKSKNPSAVNHYTFGIGKAHTLSMTYTKKSLGLLLGVRRSENFDNHSSRTEIGNDLCLNHLLPFTPQQTYTLAALYPYATQRQGEWALQGEARYTFKRGTALGGKYGTKVRVAMAYVAGLDSIPTVKHLGTKGPQTSFLKWGQKYYHDLTLEISKKLTSSYNFTFMYSNQAYNQLVVEGHADNGDMIKSHIFIYDGKHRLSRKVTLRTEAQYFHSRQAFGDWVYGLVELSLAPHFVFSVSDLWNTGTTNKHYAMASVAGIYKMHRLQLGFGRTREGMNCSGGVCRLMPATEGWNLSYSVNF